MYTEKDLPASMITALEEELKTSYDAWSTLPARRLVITIFNRLAGLLPPPEKPANKDVWFTSTKKPTKPCVVIAVKLENGKLDYTQHQILQFRNEAFYTQSGTIAMIDTFTHWRILE